LPILGSNALKTQRRGGTLRNQAPTDSPILKNYPKIFPQDNQFYRRIRNFVERTYEGQSKSTNRPKTSINRGQMRLFLMVFTKIRRSTSRVKISRREEK